MFLQQNSLSLLTGSAPSAASFCFYFSYSVSLGERIIYHRLRELYVLVLCVLVFLHSLCGFNNFFGLRAVFGLDACHLFPQPVLSFIPLIGGMQMPSLCTLPGRQDLWLPPICGILSGGSGLCLPLEIEMAGASQATGAYVGSTLPPESTWRERNSYSTPVPLLLCPPTMAPCLSGGPKLLFLFRWLWRTIP